MIDFIRAVDWNAPLPQGPALCGVLLVIALLALYLVIEVKRTNRSARRQTRIAHLQTVSVWHKPPSQTEQEPSLKDDHAAEAEPPWHTPQRRGLVRNDDGTWRTYAAQVARPTLAPIKSAPQSTAIIARPPSAPPSPTARYGAAISDVFGDAGIGFKAWAPAGQAPQPVRSARAETFFVVLAQSSDLEKALALSERLAMRGRTQTARVARYGHKLGIEFTLPENRWRMLRLEQPGAGRLLRLGLNTLNQPVQLDIANPDTPHALLAGGSGCGKTTLLRSIVYQVAQADPGQQRVLIVDGKGEFEPFYRLPHLVSRPAISPEDGVKALAWVAAEILRRSQPGADMTPLIVAIDEIGLLAQDRRAVGPLGNVLSLGRSKNIHVVGGVQHATSPVMGSPMVTANFKARLCGHVVNANESQLATGQPQLGAHMLSGKGDFIGVWAGAAQRFVAAVVDDGRLASLPHVDEVPAMFDAQSVEPLAMLESAVAERGPLPTTPAQYATVIASYVHGGAWPSVRIVSDKLGVGRSGRAQRIIGEAQELVSEFERAGIAVIAVEGSA